MKRIYLIISIIFIPSYFLEAPLFATEVRISGEVLSASNLYVNISKPINGSMFHGFHERYELSESGKFNIGIDLEVPGFLLLEYVPAGYVARNYSNLWVYFFVQPGDSLHITINAQPDKYEYKIFGSNAEGQNLYNSRRSSMNLSEVAFGKSFHYSDSLSATELKDSIGILFNHETILFKELLLTDKIDTVFYSAILNDLKHFFGCYLAEIIQNVYFGTSMPPEHPNYKELFPDDYAALWEQLFDSIPPLSDEARNSTWFAMQYAWKFMWYNGFYLLQQSGAFDTDKMNENLWKYLFDSYKSSFSRENLEFSLATYLWTNTYNRFDLEFLDLIEEFQQMFPDSKYLDYVMPRNDRIRVFHEIADEAKTRQNEMKYSNVGETSNLYLSGSLDDVHILERRDTINSFQDAIAPFKGKAVYVSIWATWCGPCIQEFKHNKELIQFLKAHNVEKLYISVDKDIYHEKWQDFINVYFLRGHHLRANENLDKDILRITGVNAIPWYLIIDKNGEIVQRSAFRPGMKQELYNQILRYCKN